MAQRRTTSLVDDLNGSVAVETVRFRLDGEELEVDLNAAHAAALRSALAPYTSKARRVSRGRSTAARQPLRIGVTVDPIWTGTAR